MKIKFRLAWSNVNCYSISKMYFSTDNALQNLETISDQRNNIASKLKDESLVELNGYKYEDNTKSQQRAKNTKAH